MNGPLNTAVAVVVLIVAVLGAVVLLDIILN